MVKSHIEKKLMAPSHAKNIHMVSALMFIHSRLKRIFDASIYLGSAFLQLPKLCMYETYDDTLQPFFEQNALSRTIYSFTLLIVTLSSQY